MSFFGLGAGIVADITLDPPQTSSSHIKALDHVPTWKVRKNAFAHAVKKNASITPFHAEALAASSSPDYRQGSTNYIYAYRDEDDVKGIVNIAVPPGKKLDHLGIKVEYVGRIDLGPLAMSDGRGHYDFISLTKELSPPAQLYNPNNAYNFHFKNVEKPYETYHGKNVSIRYLVRVSIERKFLPPISSEKEVIVQIIGREPQVNEAIKMEVGIEDCLHIEFEYEKRWYHLRDTIRGKINFLLVKIKIKYMELAVIRRETSGENVAQLQAGAPSNQIISGPNIMTETQTLVKYEIMDGAPVKGETVSVKMYLGGIPADLTPTIDAAQNNRFSVRYFLNLVLVDEEDRRYFKQQEIILWRKDLG